MPCSLLLPSRNSCLPKWHLLLVARLLRLLWLRLYLLSCRYLVLVVIVALHGLLGTLLPRKRRFRNIGVRPLKYRLLLVEGRLRGRLLDTARGRELRSWDSRDCCA